MTRKDSRAAGTKSGASRRAAGRDGQRTSRAPAPRRGRAAPDRTEEILALAAAVFAKQGFSSTDLQDIADGLGIGKASLYRRFPSKGALFLATVDRVMLQLRAAVEAAVDPAADALEQIAAAVREYLAFFDSHPHYVELLIQERADFKHRKQPTYFVHRRNAIQRWTTLYERLMDEGRVRRMPVERITDVLSSAVYGTMFTNFFAGRSKSHERQASDLLEVVFHGILAPGARGLPDVPAPRAKRAEGRADVPVREAATAGGVAGRARRKRRP